MWSVSICLAFCRVTALRTQSGVEGSHTAHGRGTAVRGPPRTVDIDQRARSHTRQAWVGACPAESVRRRNSTGTVGDQPGVSLILREMVLDGRAAEDDALGAGMLPESVTRRRSRACASAGGQRTCCQHAEKITPVQRPLPSPPPLRPTTDAANGGSAAGLFRGAPSPLGRMDGDAPEKADGRMQGRPHQVRHRPAISLRAQVSRGLPHLFPVGKLASVHHAAQRADHSFVRLGSKPHRCDSRRYCANNVLADNLRRLLMQTLP